MKRCDSRGVAICVHCERDLADETAARCKYCEPPKEVVDHPSHYNAGNFEVIAVIQDWQLGFCEGNVVKYVARAKHKQGELEDLKKARWYLDYRIQELEAAE